MANGTRWTREQLLVALNVYHKLNFGQFHSRQPLIIDLAERMGRTPGSVAMKLSNFASLDPVLKLRGIRGLEGASDLDREMWDEFHANSEEAVAASEQAVAKLFAVPDEELVEVSPTVGFKTLRMPGGPTESMATVKQRRGQQYFRDVVLNNFGEKCGVTGLAIRELLVASHIVPWKEAAHERLNVQNGLALSRLHDAAFDLGLIGFDDDLRMLLSPRIREALGQRSAAESFGAYAGEKLLLPEDAIPPRADLLAAHRQRHCLGN